MGLDAKIVVTILLGLFALVSGGFGIAFFGVALHLGASIIQAAMWGPTPVLLILSLLSGIAIYFVLNGDDSMSD